MNKTQLVAALAGRIGDRRTAAIAVDGLLEIIVDAVCAGDSVSLSGFGVFSGRARAARVARNPRTGGIVEVPATTVPAFRPGTGFRAAVGGSAPAPGSAPVRRTPAVTTLAPVTATEPVAEAPAPSARGPVTAKGNVPFAVAPAAKAEKPAKGKKPNKGKPAKAKKAKAKK
ncbi:MAG: HU family DNA-binding protein [Pseudonocardia sp.]